MVQTQYRSYRSFMTCHAVIDFNNRVVIHSCNSKNEDGAINRHFRSWVHGVSCRLQRDVSFFFLMFTVKYFLCFHSASAATCLHYDDIVHDPFKRKNKQYYWKKKTSNGCIFLIHIILLYYVKFLRIHCQLMFDDAAQDQKSLLNNQSVGFCVVLGTFFITL